MSVLFIGIGAAVGAVVGAFIIDVLHGDLHRRSSSKGASDG